MFNKNNVLRICAGLILLAGSVHAAAQAQLYFIYTDHLNTPRLIANATGQTVWTWANDDPFGNNAPNENPSNLGNFTCNLRLPGQYFDQETNTHYNNTRDYDPSLGRYFQADPIGLDGGMNAYLYAVGNPVNLSDPSGLCPNKKTCDDMIKPIRALLNSAYPNTYKGIKCTVKCANLSKLGRGLTIGNTVYLNTADYGVVDPRGNLINYIQTMAHELRHCKSGFWSWNHFGSSNPDSWAANQSHIDLDHAAETDAWGVVGQAQKLF